MGRTLVASMILRLRDLVSPGLGALQRRIQALRDTAGRIGAIGAVVAGVSLAAPIREAAAFDDTLRQTAITAGLSGAEVEAAIARQRRAYERLAIETGQRSQAIAEAAAQLQAANLTPEVITGLLPTLARAATATGAQLTDLSSLAIALNQNLRIGPEEMAGTLAALAEAGKQGRFELRDMAREFPQLAAAVQALGVRGRPAVEVLASMLQLARQGAATGSEAATNLTNLISKITAPETVRNFRAQGSDLPALIRDAIARNINPVEAVIQEVRRISQGDMFRVGEIFGDMQVLNALRPFMTGTREYLRILEQVRAAQTGLIDTDFETRARGGAIALALVEERLTQIGRRGGDAFSSGLGPLNEALALIQRGMAWLDAASPGTLDLMLKLAGGAVFLAGVLGVLGVAAPAVAAGFGIIGSVIAAVLSPIGLAVAVIAGAALLVWRNWDRIGPWFARIWAGLVAGAARFATWIGETFTAFIAARRDELGRIWRGLVAVFGGVWSGVRDTFTGFARWVEQWIAGPLALYLGGIPGALRLARDGIAEVWAAVQARFTEFAAWVDDWTGGALTAAVASIRAAWEGLTGFFNTLWDGIERRFNAVWDRIRPVLDRIESFFGAAPDAPAESGNPRMTPDAREQRRQNQRNWGREPGLFGPEPMSAPDRRSSLTGRIEVVLAPGLELRRAESDTRDVTFVPADAGRGRMLGLA